MDRPPLWRGGLRARIPPETALVFDSAGVVVVESSAPGWGAESPWRVEGTPVLDLATSGTGPAHEFYRVRDATRFADGRVAVLSEGTDEVRFYSPSGAFEGAVGRTGDGPGEFQRPISVEQYRGDSLVVFDYWRGRLTVLDASRRVARMARFTAPFTQELHALGDGRFVLSVYDLVARDVSRGRFRVPQPLILTSPDATELDTIVVVPGLEEFVFEEGSGAPPLGRTGSTALADDRVITSDGEGVVLHIWGLDGRLQRLFRIRDYPLDAPDLVRDSIRDALLRQEGPEIIRAAARDMSDEVPATYPGVMDILVDAEGHLWTAQYFPRQVTGQPRSWLVFDQEGVWLGKVVLPPDFDAYEIGSDYILGRKRDALEVETVQLLRLVRP